MRFAEYDLDAESGVLRNGKAALRLPEQPLQVLLLLLSRPGQVVTREELRSALWPDQTYVDFEDGLNHAVRRLREVLADSSENPRFIQTVPRRGYRFVCPIGEGGAPAKDAEGPPWGSLRKRRLFTLTIVAAAALLSAFSFDRVRHLLPFSPAPRLESLAVLPVNNYTGDPQQDFFADGMTDTLIADLSQIKAVKVISRTSVMHYKGTTETVPQIARELGVEGVVETSMMRSGNRVRITAQLIDARDDRHLWASNYEREMTDALALQSDLVQAIASEIRVQVTPQESMRLRTTHSADPGAVDATLKGRTVLDYATREEQFRQAIGLFQDAVDRDPAYAPAWAGLGEAQWGLAAFGFEFVPPGEVRDTAIEADEKALKLDPNLAEAHKARALVAYDGEWDIARARQEFEEALELQPGDAATHDEYGHMLGGEPLPDFDDARRHFERARELDPLSPWSDINMLAWWLFQGRPEKALEVGERSYQDHPTVWVAPWQTGFAQLGLQQPSHAVPLFEAALKLLQTERSAVALAPLGLAYGLAGRRSDAVKILEEMERTSKQHYVSPYYLAVVHSGIGQMDEAFQLLDAALEQRTPYLVICTRYDPLSTALRRDRRWRAFTDRLRKQVRLPPGVADPYGSDSP
jgi:TolB-like protein/DNA-binding winged helix-turn-helix (wHTH) protein/Tfp pilus assembly protein PilF